MEIKNQGVKRFIHVFTGINFKIDQVILQSRRQIIELRKQLINFSEVN